MKRFLKKVAWSIVTFGLCAFSTNGFAKGTVSNIVKSTTFTKTNFKKAYVNSSNEANVIVRDLKAKETKYEYFNEESFSLRKNAVSIKEKSDFEDLRKTSAVLPSDYTDSPSVANIIGDDDRTVINSTKSWPYRATALIIMTFDGILNNSTGKYVSRSFVGTGFMEGKNLLVSAAHCAYGDVSSDEEFEDNIYNPRFADKIEVYAGINGSSEKNDYIYYAEVSEVSIQKEYYESKNYGDTGYKYDWCAMKLDRDLGLKTGNYGKICNYYKEKGKVFSYGYPATKGGKMYYAAGRFVASTAKNYTYDMDSEGGQSGSPLFITGDDGNDYVCGIHTSSGGSTNGGIIFNSFVYSYLDSFVYYNDNPAYLGLSVVSKNGSVWNIKIKNTSSSYLTVYYNRKMCFYNDAKNWSGLSDIEKIGIAAGYSAQVQISENWWATAISTSYLKDGKRIVTYADGLSTSGALNEYRNILEDN